MNKYLILLSVIVASVNVIAGVTKDDYQRAEQQLSTTTNKLVTNKVGSHQWANDHILVYRTKTTDGVRFYKVDAKYQNKELAFDHQKLAKALSIASNTDIKYNSLPFSRVMLNSHS
ncbi:MAG: hypothetical protein HWE10_00440 [Gammaproteobacteria bacterium]|nr:hypothetical protein [Gammaproteobacteria bacterium]